MTTSEDTPDKRRDFSDNSDSDTEGKNLSSDESGNSSPQHRQELGTTDSPTTTMPSSQLERVSETLHDQPNQTNEMNNEYQVNNKNDKKVTRGTFSHEFDGTSVGAYDDSTDNFKIQPAGKTTNHLQEQESQQQEPDSVVDSSGASSSLPISESIDLASPLSETVTDNLSMKGTPPISYLSSGQPQVLPNAGMIQQSPQIVKSTESDMSILSPQQIPPPQFIPNMRYNGAPATVDIPQVPQIVIPTVQRHAMPPTHINGNLNAHINNGYYLPQNYQQMQPMTQISVGGGKRKIHLRLMEDVPKPKGKKVSFLSFGKGKRGRILSTPLLTSPKGDEKKEEMIQDDFLDRGRMTVSWYEGTTSLELYQHVRNSVIRKLDLHGTAKLGDLRILDEAFDPPEEIVLTPFIPSGSRLLLRFSTNDKGGDVTPVEEYDSGAPLSPSAAPSPYPSTLDLNGLDLNPTQLALLGTRLQGLELSGTGTPDRNNTLPSTPPSARRRKMQKDKSREKSSSPEEKAARKYDGPNETDNESSTTLDMSSFHPEDPIEKSIRRLTQLLIADRSKKYVPPQEKKQVIFVLANYFVLFLGLIAISAEISARLPEWQDSIEQQLKNVQNCSRDEDSLYQCVSKGDLAGLVASILLWISRSAVTKRIFLFGFENPRKLWTVVYESLVSSVCWGFSYIFIRRGMNPDTNRNFLQKYWKDAVYGSLAGFNAAFMKHVLKNLIPQEAIEDALMQDRKLKILSWLPSFSYN